ncbi:MAG: PepSY domain-containing protein [Gemmatimonadaceae bacterium]|nr:PepSY domain-containing protein [Gemmatimonadaceae bacterium]
MSLNKVSRRVHYWASFAAALPILVMLGSGILLQLKKQVEWVQPAEIRGTGTVPAVGFPELISAMQTDPSLGVKGWDDVSRIDVRADRGLAKVTLKTGWEAQIDLGTGKLLKTAVRRSDLIESLHDGSYFAGDWTKLGLFLPAGLVLLVLWLTGLWMFWVTWNAKQRRKSSSR